MAFRCGNWSFAPKMDAFWDRRTRSCVHRRMRLETLGDKTALLVGWRSGSPMALRVRLRQSNKAEAAEFRRRKRGLEAA